MKSVDDVLASFGYKLAEDAWQEFARRSYVHDENATLDFMLALAKDLRPLGWIIHPDVLRAFSHPATGEMIEVEPGGPETRGHWLHFLKPE